MLKNCCINSSFHTARLKYYRFKTISTYTLLNAPGLLATAIAYMYLHFFLFHSVSSSEDQAYSGRIEHHGTSFVLSTYVLSYGYEWWILGKKISVKRCERFSWSRILRKGHCRTTELTCNAESLIWLHTRSCKITVVHL